MDGVTNNPFLKPKFIMGVIDELVLPETEFRAASILPSTNSKTDTIFIDVQKPTGGMVKPVAPGAESPIIEFGGARQESFTPAHFREKVILAETDIRDIRRLGTHDERKQTAEMIADKIATLRMRTENRIEWTRWEALKGSLTINENDVAYNITYSSPANMTPTLTGNDLWSNAANAEPVRDITDWKFEFRNSGASPGLLMFNAEIERLLYRITSITGLLDRVFNSGNTALMNRATLGLIFRTFIGETEFEIFDGGFFIHEGTRTAIANGAVNPSVTVDNATGIEPGDTVTLVRADGNGQQNFIVNTVAFNNLDLVGTATVSFPSGATLSVRKIFIPDDTVFLFGVLPPGTLGGRNIGNFVSTFSVYGRGNLINPVPGPFAQTNMKLDDDPPRIEIISGINGLPVIYHRDVTLRAIVT